MKFKVKFQRILEQTVEVEATSDSEAETKAEAALGGRGF